MELRGCKVWEAGLLFLVAEWLTFTVFGVLLLMIYILHYLTGPKPWDLWCIPSVLVMGSAGFIPSTV